MRWYDGHLNFLTFLDVRPPELGEGVLSMLGMGRSGIFEIFFDPLSRAVLRFLLDGLEPRIIQQKSASHTFSAVRGLMMSIVSVFRKACRA